MEEETSFEWWKLPNLERKGSKQDHGLYESLDEGRIPTPIPFRVKSGRIGRSGLAFYTTSKSYVINWHDVELICLGVIRNEVNPGKVPKSRVRKLLRQTLLGEEDKVTKTKEYNFTYLLDIYVHGNESPFRIDRGTVNYKSFLSSTGYVSHRNFIKLVNNIVYFSMAARLNEPLKSFLDDSKAKPAAYDNIYDFELDSQESRWHLEELTSRKDLNMEIEE